MVIKNSKLDISLLTVEHGPRNPIASSAAPKETSQLFKALTPIPGPGLSFQYQTSGKWTGAYRKPFKFCTQIPFYLLFFCKRTLKKKKLVPRANEVIGGASCKLQLVKISQIENVVQTFKLVAELFSCGVV